MWASYTLSLSSSNSTPRAVLCFLLFYAFVQVSTVLGVLLFYCYNSPNSPRILETFIPFYMKKLRPREGYLLLQGLLADIEQSQNLNLRPSHAKTHVCLF